MNSKNRWCLILALLAGIPLFFIHVCSTHDWGDDFARYLEQVQNLMQGESQDKTFFIQNPEFFIGPHSYPAGFPIILAIWGKIFSLEMVSLNYLISVFLFFAGMAMMFIFRKSFSLLTSACLLLLFLYHPLTIALKANVLSDIPYTAITLLCLLIYHPEKKSRLIISALLLAFSVHVRTIGYSLVLAFIALHLFEMIKSFRSKEKMNWKKYLFFWGPALLLFIAIKFIFPVQTDYSMTTAARSVKETFLRHSYYYLWVLDGSVKEYNQESWRLLGMLAGSAFIVLGILGWILSIKKDPAHRLYGFYCLAYFLLISFYPYGDSGFRFVFPIFGFVLFYAAYALRHFLGDFNFNKKILAVVITAVLLFQFSFGWKEVIKNKTDVIDGPYAKDATETFSFISKQTSGADKICFAKPKALSYFCSRSSLSIDEFADKSLMKQEMAKQNCSHYLFYNGISGSDCLAAISSDTVEWKMVFSNASAKVFRRK